MKSNFQNRAVKYGAQDVEPTQLGNGDLEWPADEERVSLVRITYETASDLFRGFTEGAPEPEWTQH